ncbi:unnamed protein product [Calypogeia fissa]
MLWNLERREYSHISCSISRCVADCYLAIDLAFEAEDLFDRSLFKEGNSALIKDQPIAIGAGCGDEMANSRHARNSATGAMVQQLVAVAVRVLVVLAMLQRAPLSRARNLHIMERIRLTPQRRFKSGFTVNLARWPSPLSHKLSEIATLWTLRHLLE